MLPMATRIHVCHYLVLRSVPVVASVTFVITSIVAEGVHMLADSLLASETAIAGIAFPAFVRSVGRAGLKMLLDGLFGTEPAIAILAPRRHRVRRSFVWVKV